MIIRIQNLKLRTLIGIYDWERKRKQSVIVNIRLDFNGTKAARTDKIKDTVDYKTICKAVIKKVESSQYFLVEKLAAEILKLVMKDKRVLSARVRVDKPGALRFAESVSVETEQRRKK